MGGLSEAFYEAMQTIASRVPARPLPGGLTEIDAGDWTLACNNGREPVAWQGVTLPGYYVGAIHKVFVAMSCIGPDGGAIAGASEDQFIEEMKSLRDEQATKGTVE